jgi:hypothetical protein
VTVTATNVKFKYFAGTRTGQTAVIDLRGICFRLVRESQEPFSNGFRKCDSNSKVAVGPLSWAI